MELRDYQRQAVDAVRADWESSGSTLLVLPTGTGKTVVFSKVLEEAKTGQSIVLAHTDELVFQAKDKIERATPLSVEIEKASMYAYTGQVYDRPDVVCGTWQTQIASWNGSNAHTREPDAVLARMERFQPSDFGILVIDEAHRAVSPSYRKIAEYYQQNPILKLLGVTATPDRHDEKALGQMFDSVAMVYEIHNAIQDGWLVPVMQRAVEIEEIDLSEVKLAGGDFQETSLAHEMERTKAVQAVAHEIIRLTGGRKTLVFCASVAHAELTCEILNSVQPDSARFVYAKTKIDERRQIVRDYAVGRFRYLCNVGCFTEGFDDPSIECVAIARPTKARSKYCQMLGRGTRPLDGLVDGLGGPQERRVAIETSLKPSVEIIDFVGNAGRHKLISVADVLGGDYDDEVIAEVKRRAESSGQPEDVLEDMEAVQRELLEKARVAKAKRRHAIVQRGIKVRSRSQVIDPFEVLDVAPARVRGWNVGKDMTDKQRAFLEKQGVPLDNLDRGKATQIIGNLMGRFKTKRCTFKQAKLLQRYGYDGESSFDQAHAIIDRLAANGWKRPTGEPVGVGGSV